MQSLAYIHGTVNVKLQFCLEGGSRSEYSARMKTVALIVSFVLALSLLVQNTCPHGYAGKTSVIRACGHCPHKLDREAMKTVMQTVKLEPAVQKQASHPPLFVLAFQEKMHTLLPAPVQTAPAFLANRYQDAGLHELLRPPHA